MKEVRDEPEEVHISAHTVEGERERETEGGNQAEVQINPGKSDLVPTKDVQVDTERKSEHAPEVTEGARNSRARPKNILTVRMRRAQDVILQ